MVSGRNQIPLPSPLLGMFVKKSYLMKTHSTVFFSVDDIRAQSHACITVAF